MGCVTGSGSVSVGNVRIVATGGSGAAVVAAVGCCGSAASAAGGAAVVGVHHCTVAGDGAAAVDCCCCTGREVATVSGRCVSAAVLVAGEAAGEEDFAGGSLGLKEMKVE